MTSEMRVDQEEEEEEEGLFSAEISARERTPAFETQLKLCHRVSCAVN